MPRTVSFLNPREVSLVDTPVEELVPDGVRVGTWYSGISAGTELTAYRGSNPCLSGTWDPEARLFRPGAPTFACPVSGWGYSEVGEVLEVGDEVIDPEPGQVVHGIRGHTPARRTGCDQGGGQPALPAPGRPRRARPPGRRGPGR